MERHFERDLEELKERLLWMGSLAERSVRQAVHAVLEADTHGIACFEEFEREFRIEYNRVEVIAGGDVSE